MKTSFLLFPLCLVLLVIGVGATTAKPHIDVDDFHVRITSRQQQQRTLQAQQHLIDEFLHRWNLHGSPSSLLGVWDLHLRNEHQVDDLENLVETAFSSQLVLERLYNKNEQLRTSKLPTEEAEGGEDDVPYFRYHDYDNLTVFLHDITQARCPHISRLFSLGQSIEGRELWGVQISTNISSSEETGQKRLPKPRFKYIANMHGDEVIGRECCLFLVDWLCLQFGKDPLVTELVDRLDIYILPSMNPDGFEGNSRYNAHGIDLNRNFPDQFIDPLDSLQGRERETQLVMEWLRKTGPFVLSANFHGGALVANYPWDGRNDGRMDVTSYEKSPDDDLFRQLALAYSLNHPRMHKSTEFQQGITNGAMWYPLYGGMQDYNYVWHHCVEITIELSNVKYPPESELQGFWEENRAAMLAYMQEALNGIRGFVRDADTGLPIENTTITVEQHGDQTSRLTVGCDPANGDFYRLVSPGTYHVLVSAPGYEEASYYVTITKERLSAELTCELRRATDGGFPGWYLPWAIGVSVSALLFTAVILVLLLIVFTWALRHLRNTGGPRWRVLEEVSSPRT